MHNRRDYTRINTNVLSTIYVSKDKAEIVCRVKNISEDGICFHVHKADLPKDFVHVGDTLGFQIIDTFIYGHEPITEILSDTCTVAHIEENGYYYIIGAHVKSFEYEEYTTKHRIMNFVQSVNKTKIVS